MNWDYLCFCDWNIFKLFSYEWQRNGHMCWKTEVESVIRMWHSFSQATSDESELRVATSWSMMLDVSCVLMKSRNRNQTSTNQLNATIPVTFWQSFTGNKKTRLRLRNTSKIYVNGRSFKSVFTLVLRKYNLLPRTRRFAGEAGAEEWWRFPTIAWALRVIKGYF